MNREIKFRLWNPERNVLTAGTDINTILLTTDSNFVKEFNRCKMVWMQFTGFKDKNGVEIYEGDIIQKHFENFEIIWNEGAWQLTKINDWYKEQFYIAYLFDYSKSTVIGNIYKNPNQ